MFQYNPDTPVHDHPSFLGREVLLKSLSDAMTRNRIFIVVGGPRTGRTSVLKRLAYKAQGSLRLPGHMTTDLRPGLAKHVVVVVDLAPLASATPVQLMQGIWNETQAAVLDPYVQNHPTPPRPLKLEILRTADPFEKWKETTEQLWSLLANTPGWCRYSLLLDNADMLALPAWHNVLIQLAESVSRDNGARPQALGLAGGAALRGLVSPHKKAMRAARVHTLEPFRTADVEALGKLGKLSPEAVAAGYQAVGGHPWLLQRYMQRVAPVFAEATNAAPPGDLNDASNDDASDEANSDASSDLSGDANGGGDNAANPGAWQQVTPERDPVEVLEELAPELPPYFEEALGALPPPARGTGVSLERSIIVWLLNRQNEGDLADAERELLLGPLRVACDNLCAIGFLDRSVRGASGTWLRLNAGFFANWVQDFV